MSEILNNTTKEMTEEDYQLFEQYIEMEQKPLEQPIDDDDETVITGNVTKIAKPKYEEFTADKVCGLLDFLFEIMPNKSKTTVKSYLRNRQISIKGIPTTKFDYPLQKGDVVRLTLGHVEETLRHSKLSIVYEDQHILVVYKKNGLLSMASESERKKTAYYILSEYLKGKDRSARIFIVHRLDRETSGLMLFAKSIKVQHTLQQNWNELVLERKYVAVVGGGPKFDKGEFTSYLGETKALKVFSTNDPTKGEKATTHFNVLKRGKYRSLVELELETGKKNQIRVHMKEMGCPIVGDKKYGGSESEVNRVALHARQIRFIHPITREELNFETSLPKSFNTLLKNG